MPIVVYDVVQTCGACPSSWEGRTEDGREVYARYRWGYLSVRIDGEEVFGKQLKVDSEEDDAQFEMELIATWGEERGKSLIESHRNMRKFCGDFSYDGSLTYEELKEATKNEIWWT